MPLQPSFVEDHSSLLQGYQLAQKSIQLQQQKQEQLKQRQLQPQQQQEPQQYQGEADFNSLFDDIFCN